MATIIDGKALAAKVKAQILQQTLQLKEEKGITPGLAVILVGDDPASRIYVRGKQRDCEDCGFASHTYELPSEVSQAEVAELIDGLNADPKIDGILVQQPLPKQLGARELIARIDPAKDVDCFSNENCGSLLSGYPVFLPCTPAGVMEMLHEYNIEVSGRECVVVGRSNIVGKPMALMLLAENGTVTVCHSKTADLAEVTRRADILVAAVGRKGLITGDMVKPGATVIDVGMNRSADPEDKKVYGDVDFESVSPKAGAITPVPGGVGPMTRAILMKNTLCSALRRAGK